MDEPDPPSTGPGGPVPRAEEPGGPVPRAEEPDGPVPRAEAPDDPVQRAEGPPASHPESARRRRRVPLAATEMVAVGVFCLALALLLPLFVYPRLALQPADPNVMQIQTSNDGTALIPDQSVPAGARVASHIPVSINTYIGQDRSHHATSGNVLWQLGTRIVAAGHLLQARIEDVSLNKRTARPSNCCGDSLATELDKPAGVPITHTGLITFPFNSRKHNYTVWDVNLNHSRVAVYSGTTRRNGMLVYKYTATNGWLPVGTRALPGLLFGLKTPSVNAIGQYADRRTYFVEPNTGATLDVEEQLSQRYVFNNRPVTAFTGLLESPSLPAHRIHQVREATVVLPWVRGRASIVLGVLALLLFAGAALLLRRRAGRAG